MARKIVVTKEQVQRIQFTTADVFGTEERRITVTLGNKDRIVMREGEPLFHSVGLFLKKGDVITCEAEAYNTFAFVPKDSKTDVPIVLMELTNINERDLEVEAGAWSEVAIPALAERKAHTDFAPVKPREEAPPITGGGQFVAPSRTAVEDAETAAPVAGAKF